MEQSSQNVNTEENLPSKEHLEKLKLQSEIHKINSDIRHANRSLFRQKEFYIAILPIVFAVFGLIFSWASGYFDVKLGLLKLERENVSQAIQDLKNDSTKLYVDYRIKVDALEAIYDSKRDSLKIIYDTEVNKLVKEKQLSDSELSKRKESLKTANLEAAQYKEIISKLYDAESSSKTIMDAQKIKIEKYEEEKNEHSQQIKSFQNEIEIVKYEKIKLQVLFVFLYTRQYALSFDQMRMLGCESSNEEFVKLAKLYPQHFTLMTSSVPIGISVPLTYVMEPKHASFFLSN